MKCEVARSNTSDYPTDNAYGIPLANKKVTNLMKDKNNNSIIIEFVELKAKMYAMTITRCLNEEIEMTRHQSCTI